MKTLIAATGSLIKEIYDRDEGFLGIQTTGDHRIRMQFSEEKHPDLEYKPKPFGIKRYRQMIAKCGGVEVFYLEDNE